MYHFVIIVTVAFPSQFLLCMILMVGGLTEVRALCYGAKCTHLAKEPKMLKDSGPDVSHKPGR